MKIAISGTAGIGKSTLAKVLANQFSLRLIDENFGDLLKSEVLQGPAEKVAATLSQILKDKGSQEDKAKSYITDRSPVDLFHTWLHLRLDHRLPNTANTEHFFAECYQRFSQYDFIIIPPWNSLELEQLGPDREGQTRNLNPLVQLRNHAAIVGYIHIWVDKRRIIEIPQAINCLEKRVAFVTNIIGNRRPELKALTA